MQTVEIRVLNVFLCLCLDIPGTMNVSAFKDSKMAEPALETPGSKA